MYAFEYKKVSSLDEAQQAFDSADDGTFMAGGMTLVPTLKQRLAMPSDVIDLGGIDGLCGISVDGDTVTIGAMTCHADVAASEDVQKAIPALAHLASLIGDPQVRNRGTIGGSIANNDPAADYPGALVGLGATVHTTKKEIAADDFFTDLFETALEEGELVTKVTFPVPDAAAYRKFPNPASRYSVVGAFVAIFVLPSPALARLCLGLMRWSKRSHHLSPLTPSLTFQFRQTISTATCTQPQNTAPI